MYQHHGLKVTVTAPEDEIGEGLLTEGSSRPALSDEVAAFLFHSTRELLFNVVKHAGVNRATLQLSYPTEDMIQLVVADEGRGYMAGGRAYDDVEGPPALLGGFGLFSIRERLAYMGGQLIVEGGPGKGTRVTLLLPLPREGEGAARPDRQHEVGDRDSLPEPYLPRRLRLVVADDHAIVRKGLVGLLNAEPDLQVVGEAGDGWEAIAKVREHNPDVVLMDLNMPRLDGMEVTRRIIAEFPGVRVIVLSMFDDSEKKALMKQLGAADYVAKGGDPASLLAAIRGLYGNGPQEGA